MERRPRCPHCGSQNVYGISRVVGYFSRIDNWNASKQGELKDRRKGNYLVPKEEYKQTEVVTCPTKL